MPELSKNKTVWIARFKNKALGNYRSKHVYPCCQCSVPHNDVHTSCVNIGWSLAKEDEDNEFERRSKLNLERLAQPVKKRLYEECAFEEAYQCTKKARTVERNGAELIMPSETPNDSVIDGTIVFSNFDAEDVQALLDMLDEQKGLR